MVHIYCTWIGFGNQVFVESNIVHKIGLDAHIFIGVYEDVET